MKNFFSLFPKKLITRAAGFLANKEIPPVILQNFINFYSYLYKIDLSESKGKQADFKTFNEFFIRDIDFTKRKIDRSADSIVSPVDGTIIRCGKIKKDAFYSAKGVDFRLSELIGKKNTNFFFDGYYIAIYLNPANHHRVYAPFDGEIFNFSYFDGKLLPVNTLGLKLFPKIFCINERLLSLMRDKKQKRTVGVLKIGATIVGGITTKYPSITDFHLTQDQIFSSVTPAFEVKKAEEIANFELGSMVFLLFAKDEFTPNNIAVAQNVKVGQKIGSFLSNQKK